LANRWKINQFQSRPDQLTAQLRHIKFYNKMVYFYNIKQCSFISSLIGRLLSIDEIRVQTNNDLPTIAILVLSLCGNRSKQGVPIFPTLQMNHEIPLLDLVANKYSSQYGDREDRRRQQTFG